MKKEIEEIRSALMAIDAYDDETGKALESLEDAMDEIDRHSGQNIKGRVHELLGETATGMKRSEEKEDESAPSVEGPISSRWHELKDHLDEWEEHHPKAVLSVGRIAEALAVVGL